MVILKFQWITSELCKSSDILHFILLQVETITNIISFLFNYIVSSKTIHCPFSAKIIKPFNDIKTAKERLSQYLSIVNRKVHQRKCLNSLQGYLGIQAVS